MKRFFLGAVGVLLTLTGCVTSNPWAGFPPVFNDPTFDQYRATYLSDMKKYRADPDAFLLSGTESAKDCAFSPDWSARFARDAFMRKLEQLTPMWIDVAARTNGAGRDKEIIVDQVAVRILEGDCTNGTLTGPATVQLSYIAVESRGTGSYMVHTVRQRETCDYVDGKRNGICRRYHTRVERYGDTYSGDLVLRDDLPPTDTEIFDYGRYKNNIPVGQGASFETSELFDGTKTNDLLVRSGTYSGAVRYQGGAGDSFPTEEFYARQVDGKIHGPKIINGFTIGCYENGAAVKRADCPIP